MRTNYQRILKNELARRFERNPKYSLRAYARALKVDAGALSRILAGKQIPSKKIASQLIEALALDRDEKESFLGSLSATHRTRDLQRLSPFFKKMRANEVPQDLSIDLYRVIADWYHAAILELTFTKDFNRDPRWVAGQLGINAIEAKLAIERLLELGLLVEKDGTLVKSVEQLTTTNKHLTTPALRKNQRQLLERAIVSLEEDPIDERSVTSMTMAIDPKKIPEAKEMIRAFNRALCDFLEVGERKRVYNLGVALYPVQKGEVK